MTLFNKILKLLQDGWFAREVHYEDEDFTVYEITRQTSKNTREIHCIIGKETLRRLLKQATFWIEKATVETVCLNFRPSKPERGKAIVWV